MTPQPTKTSSQAPSYASPKLRLTDLLTGVKCRATSVAKNILYNSCVSKCQFVEKPIGSFGPHLELGLCIVCSVGCISCSVVSRCQLVEKHSGFLSVAPTSTHPAALFRSTWFTQTAAHITLASFYSTQHPNS